MEPAAIRKKIFVTILFFVFAPLSLVTSIYALSTLPEGSANSPQNLVKPSVLSATSADPGVKVYASLPVKAPSQSVDLEWADGRPEVIKQYLARYGSPLVPLAAYLVETADKYGMDYRLLPAIAQQESNLCKYIPQDSHNCWGWGIHSRGSLGFETYEEAIETVAKGLRSGYLNLGLLTPEMIMTKYTPLSNGSWASGVSIFMEDMSH